MDIIEKARIFCIEKHKGQTRKLSGLPYVNHVGSVAWLITVFKESKNMDILVASALLHDTVEDCDCTIEEIRTEFGDMVASIVEELTNDKTIEEYDSRLGYLVGKLLTISNYALAIKLCDILHNLSDCEGDAKFRKSFKKKYRPVIENVERYRTLTGSQAKILIEIKKYLSEE